MKVVLSSFLLTAMLLAFTGCGIENQSVTETVSEPTPPIVGASLAYTCSVPQGFNFQKDVQVLVGHLDSLKVGDIVLQSDFNVTDPLRIVNIKPEVGVLSSIYWSGGYADPIQLNAQVSTTNKNLLYPAMLDASISTVDFQFTVYDYDPKTKVYFKTLYSSEVLKGKIQISGGDRVIRVNSDQSMEVPTPKNYTISISVMPQDIAQTLNVATSTTNQGTRRWGSSANP